ncbi:DMT family transporter [Commensalibacter papalotli (ex Botero et al. 2024)]|uniref:DMT family transporter n=1 Tax=Commensalibacter papalotli (ex Botero et al. 2024) TaxID=2972766 RepID=UPI0022FF55E4|nr:EamA family transporter [Commensalibacter papalotli (ex Botero et al. 2024)]CAI3950212.1 Permease of the drug/metabolite transporter (DMT) superfamily (RhaT) (PDB:5I20) [Commensalibacter papalotli (ex Botero et al. 2024)]
MNSDQKYQFSGILCILIASALWGTTGVAAAFAPQVSPLAIGAVAMVLSGILQFLFNHNAIRKNYNIIRQYWFLILVSSIALAVYPLVFYTSMHLSGVAIGNSVTIGSTPIMSIVIEAVISRLRITYHQIAGAGLGVIGIILLAISKNSVHDLQSYPYLIVGVVLGIFAGFAYALYSWIAQHLIQKNIPSNVVVASCVGISGILLLPLLFITGRPLLTSWHNLFTGLYIGCIPMFLGHVCFGYGLRKVKASIATTLTLFKPVVAIFLAITLINEHVSLLGWVGIFCIFICLFFTIYFGSFSSKHDAIKSS